MTDPSRIRGGGHIIAADIRNVAPLSAVKFLDQSVGNSTLVFDNDLVLPLDPNAVYDFAAFIVYEGGVTGSSDISVEWSVPNTSTLYYQAFGSSSSNFANPAGIGLRQGNLAYTLGTNGAGALACASMWGTLRTSTDTGTFIHLKWAQATSNATPTIVHGGSELKLIKTSG